MEAVQSADTIELLEERLPWRKPELERLKVSLDTREGSGSTADSYVFTGGAPV